MCSQKIFKQSFIFIIIFLFVFSVSVFSKQGKSFKNGFFNPKLNKVLKWRMIGPHRGGRVVAVTGHPEKKDVFYFGGTGSGVWKTENGGETWENISDEFFKTSSVGAINVSKANPSIIYVGMGESCPRGNISHGDGVYKSTNNGRTWEHMGLEDTRHIAKIIIHPRNPDIVYVVALGHIFGPNKERGVFKTTDGGKTWEKILYKNEDTGAVDLAMNPEDPNEIYAAMWEVRRYPWGFKSGGKGSSIYKTNNGGKTWKELTNNNGLPKGIMGRIGITISKSKPERVWAIVEAEKKGLFLSDNRGKTWKLISTKPELFQRPWYYHHIEADPKDPDTLYVMNVGFWKTENAGKTFERIRTPHGDNHDLWIDENNPKRMIEGNDGGATVSFDGGKSWSSIYNQPTAQFYHVTTDNQFPYRVYGAQQDNSTISVPSRSMRGVITSDDWYSVGGCESGYIEVDPENPDIVYAGCYDGVLTRYNHELGITRDVSVWPENPMGAGAKNLKYRFQWTFPIHISPHDPDVLYTTGNHVFRSTSEGQSWEKISPDLTRNDPEKLVSSGGPLTKDNTSVEYYCTIFAFAESPVQKGVLWAGSDDGLIHVSTDNGKTWKNVTPKKLPEWSLISIIDPSNFEPGTAYVAATRYKQDDFRPYLLKTTDYGESWEFINNGIPENDFTRVIRQHPEHKNFLFAGTETGVYFSYDGGKKWHPLKNNLPVTPVHDMVIHNNDLILATHGRSFWILDDLSKLKELVELKQAEKTYLFEPRDTIRCNGRYYKGVKTAGESLPVGVIIDYYIPEIPKKAGLKLNIKDSNGNIIRDYSVKKTKDKTSTRPGRSREAKPTLKEGLNQFVWNYEYEPAAKVPKAVFWYAGPNVAPKTVPGEYSVELIVGDTKLEQEFEILKDPRLSLNINDYEKQFNLLKNIRDKLSETHQAVNNLREIQKQINYFMDKIKGKQYEEQLKKQANNIKKKLQQVENELIQHKAKARQDLLNYPIKLNNKLAALASVVSRTDAEPTEQSYKVFGNLKERVDKQLNKLEMIIKDDLQKFNDKIYELKIPAIITKEKNK